MIVPAEMKAFQHMILEMTECMRNHESYETRGLARREVNIAINN
jgi:hypothetical protein